MACVRTRLTTNVTVRRFLIQRTLRWSRFGSFAALTARFSFAASLRATRIRTSRAVVFFAASGRDLTAGRFARTSHAFAVVYNLYANAVGATAQDLVIWPAAPRS